jgi:signal peptidase I
VSAARQAARLAGLAARFAGWAAAGLGLGLLAALALPLAFDMRPFTVMTGSMRPAVDPGDVVVVQRIAPLDAHPGDIVTFRDPEGTGRLISHRVRGVRVHDGRVDFQTRGDANTEGERWSVPAGGSIGRAAYRLPQLGYAAQDLGGGAWWLALLIVPILGLLILELVRVWRPRTGHAAP